MTSLDWYVVNAPWSFSLLSSYFHNLMLSFLLLFFSHISLIYKYGTGLLRQDYDGEPIIRLRNTCSDSEEDFYGTLTGTLVDDVNGNSVYDFQELESCQLRVVQWYDQFRSGGKDLYQEDDDYQPRYLPKNGTVWFDTNNQSGYETYLHYGETSNDWYTATKYPFDYGYIYGGNLFVSSCFRRVGVVDHVRFFGLR